MKRKFLCLITALAALFAIGVFAVACTPDNTDSSNGTPAGETAAYTVTVKNPDGSLASGITVSWVNSDIEYGKATTDADGKATAELYPATYRVVLSGLSEGMTAPGVSVTSSIREITLTLSYEQVKYTATVVDKNGAPAADVTVTWIADTKEAGTAQTNAEGVAECTLDHGEYTVTVSDLPAGNIAPSNLVAYGTSPAVRFELVNGETVTFTVTVRSEGGLKFADTQIMVLNGSSIAALGRTDENGVRSFTLPKAEYRATLTAGELPDGYTFNDVVIHEGTTSADLVAYSHIITELPQDSSFYYVLGDIFHDYTFTTPYAVNGSPITVKVSEALATKKMIILNNWGTDCTWCVKEMPAMDSIYAKYGDDVEIIAVSNYSGGDSDSKIIKYYEDNGYSFPMLRDTFDFARKFNISSWPTTVIIDRYGAVARIEVGALDEEGLWERLIETYCDDNYTQTFIPGDRESESIRVEVSKPDVVLTDDHYEQVASVLNNTDEFPEGTTVKWYGAPDNEEYAYAWPFVLGTEPDVSPDERVLYASNTGKHNSYSVLFATVKAPAGSVFTFDYYSSTEKDDDALSILWDGKIVGRISGDSDGWQTCKLYADLTPDDHTLAITYMKDSSTHRGKDNVFFRNVRFTALSEITESTDMLRAAAYGTPQTGATEYPYYAPVSIGEDSYYHVNVSGLQNAEYAGNDPSPVLYVNLRNATNWMGMSINEMLFATDEKTDDFMFDTVLTVNGVTREYRPDLIKYASTAAYSDIAGYVPVDKELHDLLIAFMAKIKQTLAAMPDGSGVNPELHDKEWLELCYFYSHYGDGEPIANPILGLTKKTAYPATLGVNNVNLYRVMSPFSTAVYSFTPETSAVYKFASLLPASSPQATQIWLYDEFTTDENPLAECGALHVTRTGENEHNFELYRYLEAGKTYYMTVAFQMQEMGTFDFSITDVGQSFTTLHPTADVDYLMILDKNDNIEGMEVANAVKYGKDEDGYYHALNADGTMGGYIYLDVKYATAAMGTISLESMLDRDLVINDGTKNIKLNFKTFDFGKAPVYEYENGVFTGGIYTDSDISDLNPLYKDYTGRMREIVANAPTSGDEAGFVRVDDEIKQIIELFSLLRNSSINYHKDLNAFEFDELLEDEWLRYCWYYRLYDQNNV